MEGATAGVASAEQSARRHADYLPVREHRLQRIERGGFAGGTGDDERVGAAGKLMIDQPDAGIEVERIVSPTKRRGQCTDAAG